MTAWVNVVLAALNAVLAAYAIVAYIGVGNSIVDVWHNVLSWLYKPQRTVAPKPLARVAIAAEAPGAHWSQTLAYAPADGVRRKERRKSSRRGVAPVGDRRSPLGDRRAPEPDAPDDMAAHHERRADDVATHHERRAPTRSEDQR